MIQATGIELLQQDEGEGQGRMLTSFMSKIITKAVSWFDACSIPKEKSPSSWAVHMQMSAE